MAPQSSTTMHPCDYPPLRRQIYSDIRRLCGTLENVNIGRVSFERLSEWGIQARPVQFKTGSDKLDFSPCFFKPLPSSYLTDYPIREDEELIPYSDTNIPESELDDILESELDESDYCDPSEVTRSLLEYVDSRTGAVREAEGFEDGMFLRSISPMTRVNIDQSEQSRDFSLYEWGQSGSWHSMYGIYSINGSHPHLVLSVMHRVDANSHSLAKGEVQACVQAMRKRYRDKTLVKFDILPILITSFVGPKHGRILQAHHTGQELVLQYSPLMSFEVEETAPTDLFTRYQVGIPVGLAEAAAPGVVVDERVSAL
ncbi:hypothetical protein BJY04DRAFT_223151 [Aspergillus karnatakaensis]|uniref:uncharacterized protein n=1 Tax=Aspergillus karnatakaensis TaxID=1810916 RepID=UPI003CCCF133